MTYRIDHSDGQTEYGYDSLEAAEAAVRSVYTHAEIGHAGDLSEGGDRTLVWASAELAEGDDGERACARISAEEE